LRSFHPSVEPSATVLFAMSVPMGTSCPRFTEP
jgi:hypothetical protein